MFKVTRILVDEKLDSYFEEHWISAPESKHLGEYSNSLKAENLFFRHSLKSTYDFHAAPNKQFIIYLSGKAEISSSNGISKIFKAGDILLVEDTFGNGHKSSILEEGDALIITLADDFFLA